MITTLPRHPQSKSLTILAAQRRAANEWLPVFFDELLNRYGPQGWWPGETPTEIVIGAILTQNTNWRNVEKAIARLREGQLLDWKALDAVRTDRLAKRIRPAGYFNVKARRLKAFARWLRTHYDSDLDRLRCVSTERLRDELLDIHGIGPETADSILLYALERPTFVIDAYARRLAVRHGLCDSNVPYDELKALFEEAIQRKTEIYNEYHALIIAVGKRHCGRRARCDGCPLSRFTHNEHAC